MLKKVFSIVLCVVLTCTMLSAFAAAPAPADIETETAYDLETGDIVVTTLVKNAESGARYTYLAHLGDINNLQPTDIAYVDEKVADGTTVPFEYTTTNAKINSVVRVSGTVGDTIDEPAPTDNYQVTVGEAEAEFGTAALTGNANAYVLIPVALGGAKVESVTVGGADVEFFVASSGIQIKESCFVADQVIEIAVTLSDEVANAYVKTEGLGITEDGALVAMAHVLGNVNGFGIEFADTESFENPTVLWDAAALGKGTNDRFAVKVLNYVDADNGFAADATVYARAYYKIGEEKTYGKVWSVTPAVAEVE